MRLIGNLIRSALLRLAMALPALMPASTALALDPTRALTQYVQNVWRVEEGLPHNSVRALKQTRDGYLWLGTYGGLARFDGVRFKVFDNRNSVLTNNEIRVLHEDARGVLWVGTTAVGLYRMENGDLHRDGASIESKTINAILSTRDGALLVGTGNGLYRLTGDRTERFVAEDGLLSNTIGALVEASDGRVFVGTEGGVNLLQNGVISKGPQPSHPLKAVTACSSTARGDSSSAEETSTDSMLPAGGHCPCPYPWRGSTPCSRIGTG